MSFLNLHTHSDYSNFRGRDAINKIKNIINYTHSLGHKGVAITEHETIASSLDALKIYFENKDNPEWKGYRLLLGNEIYLCPNTVNEENKLNHLVYPHFILIALNAEGHKQIRELSTRAWSHSFMHVMMRVPTYYDDLFEIIGNNPGNVVGSTACLGSAIDRKLLEYKETNNIQTWNDCIQWAEGMRDLFGEGKFFLELQPSNSEEQIYVNEKLIKISKLTGIDYIITTDAHYLKKSDRPIHKAFLEAEDSEREVDAFYETTYIMSEAEIHEYMDAHLGKETVTKGINNTMLIYDMAEEYDLRKSLEIPYVPLHIEEPDKKLYEEYKNLIPELEYFYTSEYPSDRHLMRDILTVLRDDKQYRNQQTYDSINECLSTLRITSEKMNVRWSAYLEQTACYVEIIWEKGDSLVGAGRGSGVGFILLNLLGITQINPLREKTKTYPWRFLNPERASILDIDIDIEGNKRDKVIQALKDVYGEDRISKVMTLSTEKSRSALLTACRGLGVDSDTASYLSSLIISERGMTRTLSQMYYGDDEFKPDQNFISAMKEYPDVWEVAQNIEGLICGVGSHAGGIILTDKPFTESTALMKTNSGDIITQFDLHMCEEVSLIKQDILSIEALDKIRIDMELLIEAGYMEWQPTLKQIYEKYLGVYTLERNNLDMWKMLWNHKVLSFFQMEKESGIQAIALAKPTSVDALTTINSVMRLMPQDGDTETPLQKYARFRNDIQEWYDEMTAYGLTQEEQDILKDILGLSFGICDAQEYLVLLTQHPKIGGFSLTWGDRLRKAVAKKRPQDFIQLEQEFFQNAKEKHLSKKLVNYVWKELIYTQRGYGFNLSHALAYSIIGLQELNLCWKYPIIYWNAANLIVDSGSLEDTIKTKSTNYGKIATAIATIQKSDTQIALPLINEANYGFKVDELNNRIIYSFKSMVSIGDEIARTLISNRPYTSMQDFYDRMIVTKIVKTSQMIKLIKAGCFIELDNPNRKVTMEYFIRNYVMSPCEKLTMQQFNTIQEYNIVPESLQLLVRFQNFKKYILSEEFLEKLYIDPQSKRAIPKCGYHDRFFTLNDISQPFFIENFTETSVKGIKGEFYVVSEKLFTKEIDTKIQPLKDWFSSEEALKAYNNKQFEDLWIKYASGTIPKWEMDSLSFYYTEHELAHINESLYGVVNFFNLPEEPTVYDYYYRYIKGERKEFAKYDITRIAGTVLDCDKDKHTVALLTCYGVVNVKFNKGQFLHYHRTISERNENEKKSVIEGSWFKRGTLILCSGFRSDQQFITRTYADTVYKHTVALINEVHEDGTLALITERAQV